MKKNCYKLALPYVIKEQIEPLDNYGMNVLNTGLYNNDEFSKNDARLYDTVGREIVLDKTPENHLPPIDEMYSNKINSSYVEPFHKSYKMIKNGNIEYYQGFNSVYRDPNFSRKNTLTVSYTDPMETKTMEYIRDNDMNRCNQKEPVTYSAWLSDTQNHREDIMSHQMSGMNRNYRSYQN
jgi:hypothetical protein